MLPTDSKRSTRIFILITIIICVLAIIFLLPYLMFKLGEKTDNCVHYTDKCLCLGILTGETIKFAADNYLDERTTYNCGGIEFCWDINETECS